MVGLTNDNPVTTAPVFKSSYTVCAQYSGSGRRLEVVQDLHGLNPHLSTTYSGSVGPFGDGTVFCSPSHEKFRFVIVHGSLNLMENLYLREVAIYARST